MGGVAKRAATAFATGGISEFTHGSDAFGARTAFQSLGLAGKPYTPQTLPQEDPKLLLAQSGGAPLLTQIALGVSVDDALAGYFGKASGKDFKQYYDSLTPEEQSALDSVKNQLTQVQNNTDLRNKAVQQVVNDFPNIVSLTAPKVIEAKQAAGQEFDAASKQYLDYAMNQTAAKYAAGGMVSSGAATAAEARTAASLGLERLGYQDQRGNQALDLLGQGWQQQYNEANALRNFQNTMLGAGAGQGFSANQAALQRRQQTSMQNAGFANEQHLYDQQSQDQMFGAVGGVVGTAAGAYIGGPAGAMAGSKVGSMAASGGFPSGTSYGSPYGSFSGNPRLNIPRY